MEACQLTIVTASFGSPISSFNTDANWLDWDGGVFKTSGCKAPDRFPVIYILVLEDFGTQLVYGLFDHSDSR